MNLNLITRDNLRDLIPRKMMTSTMMRIRSLKVQMEVMLRAKKTMASLRRQSKRGLRMMMAIQNSYLNPKLKG
jgi:hypothetical protein